MLGANDDDGLRRRMRWRRIVVFVSSADASTVRREGAEVEFAGYGR